MSDTRPKWDMQDTIYRGRQATKLFEEHGADFSDRIKPGEREFLGTGVDELERCNSGQSEVLVEQKSKTQGRDQAIEALHNALSDIKNMVKAAAPDEPEKLKAFGVGEKVNKNSVSSVRAAANIIINGYNENSAWANGEAGIIEQDIQEIEALSNELKQADTVQEHAKLNRKVKTIDKNSLQRQLEDLVTKISAIGIKVYRKKNPSLVPLFEDLVPGIGGGAKGKEPPPPQGVAAE
jgi:hypothetical protein